MKRVIYNLESRQYILLIEESKIEYNKYFFVNKKLYRLTNNE